MGNAGRPKQSSKEAIHVLTRLAKTAWLLHACDLLETYIKIYMQNMYKKYRYLSEN